MNRKLIALVVGTALLAPSLWFSSEVFAQAKGKGKAAAPAAGGGGDYQKTTKYDFEDDVVTGDLVRPDGEMVDSRRGAKHSSLIKIRQHFIPEMLKSAEDI
jgi:hypothetical protein